jgi:DNA-binding transcriptional ArsR family regulator
VIDPKSTRVQGLLELDRVVHEPARLAILTILAAAEEVEFSFLEAAIGLTKGNLSSHLSKLEAASYIVVYKAFRAKKPVTSYRIAPEGRQALERYRTKLLDGLKHPHR